jgi:hypothetical protein
MTRVATLAPGTVEGPIEKTGAKTEPKNNRGGDQQAFHPDTCAVVAASI